MHDTALQTFTIQTEIGFISRKGFKIVCRAEPSVCLPSVYMNVMTFSDLIPLYLDRNIIYKNCMKTLKISYFLGQ